MRALLVPLLGAAMLLTIGYQAFAIDVRDEAKLFSETAIEKANAAIRAINDKYKHEFVVETFATVPKTMIEKVAGMTAKEKAEFFRTWGIKREEILGTKGVHLLISKSPTYLQVTVAKDARKYFTDKDATALSDGVIAKFKAQEMDEGLSWAVAFVEAKFKANIPPSLASKLAQVKVELYAEAPNYCEGPTWRDGELFFCSGELWKVDRNKKAFKYLDINPAGTYLLGDGRILICDNKVPALLELSADKKLGVVVEEFQGKKLRSLNDLTVDKAGNVYWTDPADSTRENPVGKIFRVRPDGKVDLLASDLAFPNGLEVDPDSKYLYVIESQTAKILRYDLPADNQPLGKPVVLYALGGAGGDGCAFDAAGNLWVADFHRPDTKQGRIAVISPKGDLLGTLNVPAKQVSNLTFGGPNLEDLFITTGDPHAVFRAPVGIPGFKGHAGKKMKIVRYLEAE